MSSDAAVLAPIFTNIPNKRKSDASSEAVSKKPRKDASSAAGHDAAKGLLKQYLKDGESFIPGDASTDDLRGLLLSVTKYAAYLETQASVAAHSKPAAGPAPKAKTREQLEELGEKLRKAARSQIKKQMTWKPSCKAGTAKWSYEGVCSDPDAFAILMNLPSPPTWKQKKIPVAELRNILDDDLEVSIRYDMLNITSPEINVKWNAETGEFRFGGTYGK